MELRSDFLLRKNLSCVDLKHNKKILIFHGPHVLSHDQFKDGNIAPSFNNLFDICQIKKILSVSTLGID